MSPEQAAGGAGLDGRSDIYSLACVFYEMITGMQAFMGPTPESVIAMRFAHPPREMRVYRHAVSTPLEAAVQRALALAPADRFATGAEFVDALESSFSSTDLTEASLPPRGLRRSALIAGAAAVVIAASALTVSGAWRSDPPLDTTRIALMPLDVDSSPGLTWRDDDLLQNGLGRWREVSIVDPFQVADLIRRQGAITTTHDAASVARAAGAGRFIRGRRSALGNDWRVSVALYDAVSGAAVHQSSAIVHNDVDSALAAYALIVDSLLLRGGSGDSAPIAGRHTRSLAAVRAFGIAQVALADWQLARADSALAAAVGIDDGYARAHLWLAQVRAWRGRQPETWRVPAERAVLATELGDRELALAQALASMAAGRFGEACAVYARLVASNDRDFAGWYGAGQCRMLNKNVQADARSPSGFRFQESAHAAMIAYQRALELLPSVYRRYQGTSFQNLQALLLVMPHMIRGVGAQDRAMYYALPGWIGDSLVLVPYPAELAVRGGPRPPGYDRAVRERGAALRQVTQRWSSAFPHSAGAKEAMAAALESADDPAAIDTLRRARELSTEPAHRAELAAREVALRIRFASRLPDGGFEQTRRLSDSLLASALNDTLAGVFVPVALLRGRCALAAQLIDRAAPATTTVTPGLYALSQRALVQQTLGCPSPASTAALRELARRIDTEARGRDRSFSAVLDGFLLLRPALQGPVTNADVVERLRASTSFPQAIASAEVTRGDHASARRTLARTEATWVRPPTPDIGLATARIWLALGDTAAALRTLDTTLGAIGSYDVAQFFYDAGTTSAYLAAAVLRDALGGPFPDHAADARRVVAAMWRGADPALDTVAARIANSPLP
jgi:tetratricopeptide (TPR) repeat protein